MFYLCLYLLCHKTLKEQDVKLLIKNYAIMMMWGEMAEGENREGGRKAEGGIPKPTKLYHRNYYYYH